MKLDGHVDRFDIFGIHGWAADRENPAATLAVDVVKNGQRIGTVPAAIYRRDLLAAGLGTGRKAFWFNPFEFLAYGENRLEVRFAGTTTLVPNSVRIIYFDQLQLQRFAAGDAMARSQERWRGAEPAISLTWGAIMTGDSFVDEVAKHVDLTGFAGKIIEAGPGYGRLLKTLRGRHCRYRGYTGLDLSADRARQLSQEFGDGQTRFVQGDVMTDVVESDADLFVSAATFDHLFPSFVQTLLNVRSQLAVGAMVCFDVAKLDLDLLVSSAWFEDRDRGGAFIRVYSRPELERLLTLCGLEVIAVTPIVAGTAGDGHAIERIFVCARNTDRAAAIPAGSPDSPISEIEVARRLAAATSQWDGTGPVIVGRTGGLARYRSKLWTALYRARHSSRLKPLMSRLEGTAAFRTAKRILSSFLVGER